MLCRECGYILSHLTNKTCPECGQVFDPNDSATYHSSEVVTWYKRIPKFAISFPLIVYAIFFIAICIDPYYLDAMSPYPEFIEWRYRWAWAGAYFLFTLPITLPVYVFGIGWLYRFKWWTGNY
ncbi:MAG: hypothetical protein AAF086_05265 [Planctomycetota bacterium]